MYQSITFESTKWFVFISFFQYLKDTNLSKKPETITNNPKPHPIHTHEESIVCKYGTFQPKPLRPLL